ncbi:MAG: radical SAM protein [bacterium]|nr:radical SAM protein [bacterium]
MLKSVHFLLTYTCLYECDHCFLHCGPHAEGTFTLDQVTEVLDQAVNAGVTSIEVEGGEPFLYYPLMLETLRQAKARGLNCGIVTNCYWATTKTDAGLWLEPLVEIGIDSLAVSDDEFHGSDMADSPARLAYQAAVDLGLPASAIRIEQADCEASDSRARGDAVIGGRVSLKGRAVDKLADGLPCRPYEEFSECTQEELADPGRVHLDPLGNVFVCQGLSIGNVWRQPLAEIMAGYEPARHPIVGPLLAGGPAELARRYGLPAGQEYVSDCHLCYLVRRNLLARFPEELCPNQVYGIATA